MANHKGFYVLKQLAVKCAPQSRLLNRHYRSEYTLCLPCDVQLLLFQLLLLPLLCFLQVFQPATVPAALTLAVGPWLPLSLHAFLPSFIFLVCMSQQFHAWSHMKKSELHPVVVALQVCRVIGRCMVMVRDVLLSQR